MKIQTFDYSVNLLQAIIWQYDETFALKTLIIEKQSWYDANQSQFWTDWYNNVFNLLTANAFGIAVWSYILNVPLYINFNPEPSDKPIFGFNSGSFGSYTNTYLNFGNSNFSTRGAILSLTLEEQRFLLRLRYFQLYTAGAISNPPALPGTFPPLTGINNFLNYLVNTSDIGFTGKLYVLDGLDMTMTYVFTTDDFPSELLEVIQKLDIMPRPAGVRLKYYENFPAEFGFNAGTFGNYENTNKNFGNGNLFDVFN